MGHSQDFRHWLCTDFCRGFVAFLSYFQAMALLGGIWGAGGNGNQFRDYHSGGDSDHQMVQPLSRKDHGGDAVGFGVCGFFQAWAIVAVVSVLSAMVAFLFVREHPEDLGQMVDGGAAAAPPPKSAAASARVTKFSWKPHQAYRTRAYWMILIGAISCQFPFFFFTAHWLLHLKGAGVRPADAAFAMGLFTLGAVFGRLIGGWLMDAMEGRYAFMLGFCCYFLGSFLAIRVSSDALWVAYSAAILYGMGFGWTFISLTTVTGHYYGPVAFPKVSGMMLLLAALFCSPAGYLGGKLFDVFHSYKIAFEINSGLAATGIMALFFAQKPEPPEAEIPCDERVRSGGERAKKDGWETRIRT